MKIYTKTGDTGETSLFGGERLSKDHIRIEAYGTVDELNSLLGVVHSLQPSPELQRLLIELQNDLFTLGADLATPLSASSSNVRRVSKSDSARLEAHIDRLQPSLEPLKNFILPGGSQPAAYLHFARTVCRRAERLLVTLAKQESIGAEPVIYLNRLSDLLFVMARWANASAHVEETKWSP